MLANDAVAGARLIGAHEIAEVIEKSLEVFGDQGLIADNDERRSFIDSLSEQETDALDALNEPFFEIMRRDSGAHLAGKEAEYIEAHPDEFFTD